MEKKNKYYVVRDKALPEVLQKVVEVKRLLEADKNMTVQEAAEQVGLSRSSFYKYKDDILPFSDNTRGKTVTLVTQMMDQSRGFCLTCSTSLRITVRISLRSTRRSR